MITATKQRILTKAFTHLGKLYPATMPAGVSVLDHLLLGVAHEETSLSRALPAYKGLLGSFHNFNELRVSHPREVAELLAELPEPELKARRMLEILRFVFETTYAFDLESMRKKPLKQAQKQLSKIAGATPFAVAAAVQRALDGHAMPVDKAMCGVLERLDLLAGGETLQEAQAVCEHLVPKAKGETFSLLISELAADNAHRDDAVAAIVGRPKRRGAAAGMAAAVEAPKPSTNGRRPATRKKNV